MLNMFFSTILCSIFRENCAKLFLGHIWWLFRERRLLAPKISVTFFYHKLGTEYFIILQFIQRKLYFLRKRWNTVSGSQVSFEGKGAFGDENKYNLFYGIRGFEYFFIRKFFQRKQQSLRIWRKKFFVRHNHFLGEGIILHQNWI